MVRPLAGDRAGPRNASGRPATLLVAAAIALGGGGQAAAQSGGPQEPPPSTLTLPLIGEVTLPGFLSFLGSPAEAARTEQPPPAVIYHIVTEEPITERFEFIGRIEAIEQVDIRARVAGYIEELHFAGGETVAAGDLLVTIEDERYAASVAAAEAMLAGAEAQRAEAERALERDRELVGSETVSEATLDASEAEFQSAEAAVLEAEAALRQARLDLDYTDIEAAIDGRLSEPMITQGNFVDAASGPIARLVQLDPVWGVFPIPESRAQEWASLRGDAIAAGEDAPPNADPGAYRFSLSLPGGGLYESEGDFAFASNAFDLATGTLEVRVRFPNEQGVLTPNQNVTLVAEERDPPIRPVVPQNAIQLGRDGPSVWVVGEDDTVSRRALGLGEQVDAGRVAVLNGIAEGERVVVRGTMMLSDGTEVSPRREGADAADADGDGGNDASGAAAGQSGDTGSGGASGEGDDQAAEGGGQ